MSSSNRRDCEICEMLTITGDKVMQSHLTKTLKDVVIYEKDSEGLSLRGFGQDKKHVVSKIKNMLGFFALVNSSLHLDVVYSFVQA